MKLNKRLMVLLIVAVAWGGGLFTLSAQVAEQKQEVEQLAKIDLSILYVGKSGTAREKAFVEFFGKRFSKVEKAEIEGFDYAKARDVGVIMLDFTNSDIMDEPKFPASFKTPTLMTGWAGAIHHMRKGKGSYA